MFHAVAQQGFQDAAKNIIFPTVKNFQHRLTADEVVAKNRHHVF